MARPRDTALAAIVLVGLAAGCASTVQVQGQQATSGPVTDSLGSAGSAFGPGTSSTIPGAAGAEGDTAGAAPRTGTAGGGRLAPGATAGTGGGSATLGPATPGAVATTGRRAPIRLAYAIWDQAGFTALTGNTQAGQNPAANQSADEREMNALVAYANATGGVGGRKIGKPIGIKVSTADATNQQTMDSYCVEATEDDHADVFIDRSFFVTDESVSCFGKHHTTLASFLPNTGEDLYRKVAPYAASTQPSVERTAGAFINGLNDARYFQGAKVGIVLDDSPVVEKAWRVYMQPALSALRVKVDPSDVYRVNSTDSSAQSSQASATVLKMRSHGVTHVVYFSGFLGQLSFTNTADSQGYYPRYGWSDYGGDVGDAGFYVSATQNRNAVAVSSSPSYVVDPADAKTTRSLNSGVDRKKASPGARRCLDVMSKYTGVDYYASGSGASTEVSFYCDNFFMWLDAARNVATTFRPANWGRGLAALGTSYSPVTVHSTDFTHRYGGSDSYRVGIYSSNAGCKCFSAITPWRRF